MPRTITRTELIDQLRALGVEPGVLVVHTAFSQVAPIEAGPDGLIDALIGAVGRSGTLVMPSMSDDDDRPFDPAATPCAGMGIVADTFWRRAGVLRSDSPHAFAAIGPLASVILEPHPVTVPHGLDSPIGRAHALDAHVLLLGVGHDADTTIHLAENLSGVRYRSAKYAIVRSAGRDVRVDYDEVDHCCQRFAQMDEWLERAGRQRRGVVGHAQARLARSRDIVGAARSRLRIDETIFLHAPAICRECDDARASMARSAQA